MKLEGCNEGLSWLAVIVYFGVKRIVKRYKGLYERTVLAKIPGVGNKGCGPMIKTVVKELIQIIGITI